MKPAPAEYHLNVSEGSMDVFVVTQDDMVLATFSQLETAREYIERIDVAGPHGEWDQERYTYIGGARGTYRIWNQTVWSGTFA